MVNEIVDAISRKLFGLFGCDVDREDVAQGLSPPCFYIESLTVTSQPLLGTRSKRGHPFDILYYPASKTEPKAEIRAVQAILMDEMETIQLDGGVMLRGTAMQCETVDGVGHFLVDYNAIVRGIAPDPDLMESLDVIPQTKGSDTDG